MDNKEQPEQPPIQDKDATLQALSNVAESMQSACTSVYAKFEKNLQLAQSMAGLFERVLKDHIDIETQLAPNQEGIQLVVKIINHVNIPIPGVQSAMTFQSDQVSWSHVSTIQQPISSSSSATATSTSSIFDTSGEGILLPPLSSHTEVLQIKTNRPVQCNATIVLYFPGPVPESTVPIEHAFGIYLMDQLQRTLLSEPYQGKSEYERSCSLDTLDPLLQIPSSLQEIKPGLSTLFKTTDGKMEIICRIEQLDMEARMARLLFFTESQETDDLLLLFIHELDMLH